MGHFFRLFVAMLVLIVAQSVNDDLTSDVYWRSKLPNSPMPMVIRQRLSSGHMARQAWKIDLVTNTPNLKNPNKNNDNLDISSLHVAVNNLRIDSSSAPFYFLERDLHVGAQVEMMFRKPLDGDHFLTPTVAASIPFSSNRLLDILSLFSINPNSFEAKKVEQVQRLCELPPLPGQKQLCTTSLESMVDFVASSLNGSQSNMAIIKAVSSTAEKETPSTQTHTMVSISPALPEGTTSVLCHLEPYPYTVYRCHTNAATKPYVVNLVSKQDGSTAAAAVACHRDTSHWGATHYALRALKVKPGQASVCHFLPVGDVAFFASSNTGGVGAIGPNPVFDC